MEKEGPRSGMGSILDNSARSYTSMQRADSLWVQERMQGGAANAKKQRFNALLFVTVEDIATTNFFNHSCTLIIL